MFQLIVDLLSFLTLGALIIPGVIEFLGGAISGLFE
jgi:hypothetical protein